MNLDTARALLGVSSSDDWPTVRDAYRAMIRATHPDLVGPGGAERSVRVNAAYRTLAVARREGRLHEPGEEAPAAPSPPRPASGSAPPRPERPVRRPAGAVAADVRIVGGDTVVLSSPPDETFRRMVEAVHALGEISYIDRSSAIFEAVLQLEDGNHASLVVSLQWRAHDATCEAFCTLEALDRAENLDVSGVVGQLVPFIPPDVPAAGRPGDAPAPPGGRGWRRRR